jgi:hypothetical protein
MIDLEVQNALETERGKAKATPPEVFHSGTPGPAKADPFMTPASKAPKSRSKPITPTKPTGKNVGMGRRKLSGVTSPPIIPDSSDSSGPAEVFVSPKQEKEIMGHVEHPSDAISIAMGTSVDAVMALAKKSGQSTDKHALQNMMNTVALSIYMTTTGQEVENGVWDQVDTIRETMISAGAEGPISNKQGGPGKAKRLGKMAQKYMEKLDAEKTAASVIK